jgi:NAD(P) transhydrogenase subunit alpha
MSAEYRAKQAALVAEHIKAQDIVVTTALVPGRKAPRIVSADMVRSMKLGSVVLDMAAESGGNVEGSVAGETVEIGGARVIGARNLPARLAPATTVLYAKNLLTFLGLLVRKGEAGPELVIDTADDLVAGTLLTRDGRVVHPAFAPKE